MLTIKSAGETNYVAAIARHDGLFSNVMSVIGMLHDAEMRGAAPVVKFDSGLYLDPAVGPNWWEYFFEPVSDLPASEVNVDYLRASMMVPLASAPWKLGLSRASELVARYIRPRQEILDEVERFFEEHLSGYYVVGVHMRGTDKQEEITNRLSDSVVLQAVGELVRQLRVPYKIFAASDESHYIGLLRRAFGDRVVSYDAVRSQSGDQPLHRSGCFPPWQIGRDAVVECWLLSKADYLFGSHSNLSMMARCLHPEMHHVCLNDVSDILSSYPARMRHLPPIRYPGRRGEGLNLSDRYRIALPKRVFRFSLGAQCARQALRRSRTYRDFALLFATGNRDLPAGWPNCAQDCRPGRFGIGFSSAHGLTHGAAQGVAARIVQARAGRILPLFRSRDVFSR